jgi:hypothetical protein
MDTIAERRPPRFGFAIEKWYADAFLDDGSLLIVTLGRLRFLGIPFDRLSVELHHPDGSRFVASGRLGLGRWTGPVLRYRRAEVNPTQLRWTLAGCSGSLNFTASFPSFSPSDPILRRGQRQLRWIVELPDGGVAGELVLPSGRVAIRGRGYRDYVALDLFPWSLRRWELRWGRAVSSAKATIWFRLATPEGTVASTWVNGTTRSECRPPVLAEERVLSRALLTDLPLMRIGPVRWLLGHLGGHPRQVRTLSGSVDGLPGRALHELVTWQQT